MSHRLPRIALALFLMFPPLAPSLNPIGAWNGQNVLHVPMSWCIVQGSPAQASPNVAGDTVTDDLIWRRHERPTDNIYINQAGITFRSAIDNAWTVLDFPIIADPDTTGFGQPGDMRGEDVNVNGVEFNTLINNCDTAWANPPLNRAGIGVTAVNAGLFHNGTNYVTVIGWGGCAKSLATNVCVTPYDGRITVVDNHYLHPSVPDRRWPGTNTIFALTDPMDQLVGHELGHALGLDHRAVGTALMNPSQQDNDANGTADNINLNATEVTTVRSSAMNVPGLEQDPPGSIVKGDVVALRKTDKVRETKELPAYLDLASVKVALDTKTNDVYISQQLFGLIPQQAGSQQFWFLIHSREGEKGALPQALMEIGAPSRFPADVVLRADVEGQKIHGKAWHVSNAQLVPLSEGFEFDLQALVMYPIPVPHYSTPKPDGVPVHHLAAVKIANKWLGIAPRRPFRVQAIVAQGRRPLLDKLDDSREERGVEFVLEFPSFPHCYVKDEAEPGAAVKITIEGLKPNRGIHGLLGPRLVFRGETDANGAATIDFPIPKDATPGLHLVTIGNDKTALTADCVVRVLESKAK